MKGLAMALFLVQTKKAQERKLASKRKWMLKGDMCVNVLQKIMLNEYPNVNEKLEKLDIDKGKNCQVNIFSQAWFCFCFLSISNLLCWLGSRKENK